MTTQTASTPTTGVRGRSWAGRRSWSARRTAEASISGQGLVDLSLVAHEFGRHAAPGPLAVTNVVAATLSEVGGEELEPAIKDLLSGEAIATWCLSEPPPNDQLGSVSLRHPPRG